MAHVTGRRAIHSRADAAVGGRASSQVSAIAEQVRSETRTALARLRDELPEEDRELLVLRIDRGLAWEELARVLLGADVVSDAALVRESARLRKRFQLVKERLRERARALGILDGAGPRAR